MNILSIETSCDETAVSVVAADGEFPHAAYRVLGDALRSQIDLHREYGGVFPSLAKRDHARLIVPLLERALAEAALLHENASPLSDTQAAHLEELLAREPELFGQLRAFHARYGTPAIDLISVTAGPGLEPALWVGVNFAKALAYLWNVPVVAANHLEGHILASAYDNGRLAALAFPALALIVSGGHTEFILMRDWGQYEKVGQTRDDAVGEAFDKVARLLGLPYPGGPEISRLAGIAREQGYSPAAPLPRAMLDSGDLDVSFSGLKTAVRYEIEGRTLTDEARAAIAREFEDAAVDILLAKAQTGIDRYGARSLIVGGGVSANRHLRESFSHFFSAEYPDLVLHIPDPSLTTDNSVMIALAGHAHAASARTAEEIATLRAEGNKEHRRIALGSDPFK